MFDRREKNAQIFQDTCEMIRESKRLQEAVKNSIHNQKMYPHGFADTDLKNKNLIAKKGEIVVSEKRTLEAAEVYAKADKKVCVLNFASATNPGGGVKNGSSAQEECICRCSTLYPCINTEEMWMQFYEPHRKTNDPLYNNDVIYTPGVSVIKSDISFPERLAERDWYEVNVLTCAAPNLRRVPSNEMNPFAGESAADISKNEYRQIMTDRIAQIFYVAETVKTDVLILGAFGCGAFRNPPEVVAQLFEEATEKYRTSFDTIEFAVFHTPKDTKNYDAFAEVFQ